MTLYWKDNDGVMWKFSDVPNKAVPFAIRAPCPCAGGYISAIRREPRGYSCCTTDLLKRSDHPGWPLLTRDLEGTTMVVTNNETGEQTRYEGVRYLPGARGTRRVVP